MSAQITETLTFLFTDIEGSTRLWEQRPEAMRLAHARHVELIEDAVKRQSGTLIRSRGEGDSTFSVFENATAAVAAASAFQISLQSEAWPPDTHIRVRAALHTGTAYPHFQDFNSSDVNRCARLRAIAHGEQTLLSGTTYQQIQTALPEGVTCKDMGMHRLKDLQETEHVYQLLHPELRADFPPLTSLDNQPNNLPRQVTSFVGRAREMEEITRHLASQSLVTLLGTGGVGKTRLALQVAAESMERYPDGVWLVELAALTDPSLVPLTVALTLGLREETGRPVTQTLMNYLGKKNILLLLDNCEHLIAACASLCADLLCSCPHLTLLATSREPLNVSGEHLWRIPSLSLPDAETRRSGEKEGAALLAECDSVRLFVERACMHRTDFALSGRNAPAIADICRRVDGIPLAIELAAARVRSLSVEQIASRLDNRFALLIGGSRTALPRQQTLSALIDWSYDLLNEAEKTLLCRLSVFAGGWTLDAAEVVCSDCGFGILDFGFNPSTETSSSDKRQKASSIENPKSKIQNREVLDLLTSLVDKSLALYTEREGEGRYHLLETMRQYGRQKLEASRNDDNIPSRHAAYYLQLAEEADANLKGAEQTYWLNRLETEHDNLRAVLAWGREAEKGAEFTLKLVGCLARFWSVHGHTTEGRQQLTDALDRTRENGLTPQRAKALNGLGTLAYEQGDYETARAYYEEALNIWRTLSDRQGIVITLANLGNVAYYQNDYSRAQSLYAEGLTIRRALKDDWGISNSLYNLGNLSFHQGDFKAAYHLYEESLTIKRKRGDQLGIAQSLMGLGVTSELLHGDFQAARRFMEESLTLFQELGNKSGIAWVLGNLGELVRKQQDSAGARAYLKQSLTVFLELGDMRGIAAAIEELSINVEAGQALWAAKLMGAAEAMRETLGVDIAPAGRAEYERRLETLREELGAEAFAAAWEVGRKMAWEEALALAQTL